MTVPPSDFFMPAHIAKAEERIAQLEDRVARIEQAIVRVTDWIEELEKTISENKHEN